MCILLNAMLSFNTKIIFNKIGVIVVAKQKMKAKLLFRFAFVNSIVSVVSLSFDQEKIWWLIEILLLKTK